MNRICVGKLELNKYYPSGESDKDLIQILKDKGYIVKIAFIDMFTEEYLIFKEEGTDNDDRRSW